MMGNPGRVGGRDPLIKPAEEYLFLDSESAILDRPSHLVKYFHDSFPLQYLSPPTFHLLTIQFLKIQKSAP
jgi:hypothetical protein